MKHYQILLFAFVIIGSCKKKDIEKDVEDHVSLNDHSSITINSPSDSSIYVSTDKIEISAQVKDSLKDYSFLDYYVIEEYKDTLAKGIVEKDGSIHVSWTNNLLPGTHKLYITAQNQQFPQETKNSETFTIFICTLPQVQLVGFSKDDTSIIVNWSKARPEHFKAYDVYVSRTDTMKVRHPATGKKIARITDINQTSFKDNSINFYYKYEYSVTVVSEEDCESASNPQSIEAGNFVIVPGTGFKQHQLFYNKTRARWYVLSEGQQADTINVIDATGVQIIDKIAVPKNGLDDISLLQMNDNSLLLVKINTYTDFTILNVDLDTYSMQQLYRYTASSFTRIKALLNGVIIYTDHAVGYAYVPATQQTFTLPQKYPSTVYPIDANTFMIASEFQLDSFYVYHCEPNTEPVVIARKEGSTAESGMTGVFTSPSIIAFGRTLYNTSFDELRSLPNSNDYFIGLSNDGQFAVTNRNVIVRTDDLTSVAQYSDAFTGYTYFSSNNKFLYILTGGSLNVQWNPPLRVFRYPWSTDGL
jgi:hypothetical protein